MPRLAEIVAAVALALPVLTAQGPRADAALPDGIPRFSTPAEIDHPYLPVVPGAVKIFSGRSGGAPVTIIESHATATRTFRWNDQLVECRIVEELVFESGAPTGQEQHFVAQADDGSVWAFGEIEDDDPTDDGGNDADEPGGWIVGAAQPSDPDDVASTGDPTLLLPAAPETGDEWHSENVLPHYVTRLHVRRAGARVRTPAGRFRDCLRIAETDVPDDTREMRWFAPGLGIVRSRARGERLSLRATTLRADGLGGRRRR